MESGRESVKKQPEWPQPEWPQPARAWALVFVLLGAYAIAFVDRQILSLLVEPVRRDLAALISDYLLRDPAQIGVAIALLCAVVVPLGALAIALARPRFVAATALTAA